MSTKTLAETLEFANNGHYDDYALECAFDDFDLKYERVPGYDEFLVVENGAVHYVKHFGLSGRWASAAIAISDIADASFRADVERLLNPPSPRDRLREALDGVTVTHTESGTTMISPGTKLFAVLWEGDDLFSYEYCDGEEVHDAWNDMPQADKMAVVWELLGGGADQVLS